MPEPEEPVSGIGAPLSKDLLRRLAPILLGLGIGIAVCAPFFRGGWLLLLDWVIGPHSQILGPTFYGLNGGINGDFLFGIITTTLVHLFGSSMTWVPIFLFFPLATYSMSRLTTKNLVAQLAGGLFFALNPFVIDRIYAGQLAVIYGYLFLPILIKWSYQWITDERPRAGRMALLFTLMISVDVHYAWIGGAIVAVAAVIGLWKSAKFRLSLARFVALIIPLNIYLAIPVLGHKLAVNPVDNNALLKAFQTRPDAHLGLLVNVLGLYGFWRPMPESSKNLIAGWPLFLAAILLIAGYGVWQLWKRDKRFAAFLCITFIVGFFLSLGDQGPTAPLFHWAYTSVPAFSMMREPEKFSAILAAVLSLGFGEGIHKIAFSQSSKKWSLSLATIGFLLEVAYNPVAIWGIHNQIGTTQLPSSWKAAAKIIGNSPGYILALPWDLYLSFPLTDRRIVANPAPAFLPGHIISGDNIELGNVYTTSISQRSAYISWMISHFDDTTHLGSLLAPLGVRYVVIYRTYATGNLSWISKQTDLTVVFDSSSEEVLKNNAFLGLAQVVSAPSDPSHLQLINDPTKALNLTRHPSIPKIVDSNNTEISVFSSSSGLIHLSIPYSPAWKYPGLGIKDKFGTVTIAATKGVVLIRSRNWIWIRLGYILSSGLFLLLLITYTMSVKQAARSTP